MQSECVLLNIQCVAVSIELLSEEFFLLRRIEREMIINVYQSSILSDFNGN